MGTGFCAAGSRYGEYVDDGNLPGGGDHWDRGPGVEGVRISGDVRAAVGGG